MHQLKPFRIAVSDKLTRSICKLVAAAVLTLSVPLSANAEGLIPLRIAYAGVISWLPAMIAKDRGFFEKNGLDVTMTKFTQIANLPGTVGKQFDIAATTASDTLYAAANGINLAAVLANTLETSATKSYQVLVREDSPIKSPKDLAGKRIAGPGAGSIMHVSLLDWVKKDGGATDGIIQAEVPFPNMADQLKAGRIDAAEQLEPFVGAMLKSGFRSLGDPLLSVADPILFTFWISDADWANKNKDTITRYRKSLEEGLDVIKNDPNAAKDVLAKYTGLPAPVVASIPFPAYSFKIEPAQLAAWQKMMTEQGAPVGKLDVSKLVVTPQ
jgi:NitT/TauT family transport system substrate-binding protein